MNSEDIPLTDRENDSQVVLELQKTRQARKRQHLENIQLSIAVLIIGSYFTNVGQELTSVSSAGGITTIFVGVSAIYIISKTVELTLGQFRGHGIITAARASTYTIYTISATGYAVFLGLAIFNFELSDLATYVTTLLIVILSVALGIRFYIKNVVPLLELIPRNNQKQMSPHIGVLLEELTIEYPKTIEKGMEVLEKHTLKQGVEIDAMMLDSNNNTVAVEIKYRTKELIPSDIQKFEEKVDADRFVVAINKQAEIYDQESFDQRGLEIITVDPYAAFGVLSSLVKFLDQKFNIIGFRHMGLG